MLGWMDFRVDSTKVKRFPMKYKKVWLVAML